MTEPRTNSLHNHLTSVKKGERVFENAFQSVSRMVLEGDIDKVMVNGKNTFDFRIFREGKKHIIGMYDEINSFVSFVNDASQGGGFCSCLHSVIDVRHANHAKTGKKQEY